MKLLFVIPPQITKTPDNRVDYKPYITIPLGTIYMAAYLRSQDWQGEMKVYDARISGNLHKEEGKEEEEAKTIFGDSWQTMKKTIIDYDPNVIAISNMFSVQIDAAFETAKICKEICPNATTTMASNFKFCISLNKDTSSIKLTFVHGIFFSSAKTCTGVLIFLFTFFV